MAKQKEVKWIKGKSHYLYYGKNNYYSFGTVSKRSFLLISGDIELDNGSFFKVKDFTEAKKIVQSLEK
jgi:hypothetical protein